MIESSSTADLPTTFSNIKSLSTNSLETYSTSSSLSSLPLSPITLPPPIPKLVTSSSAPSSTSPTSLTIPSKNILKTSTDENDSFKLNKSVSFRLNREEFFILKQFERERKSLKSYHVLKKEREEKKERRKDKEKEEKEKEKESENLSCYESEETIEYPETDDDHSYISNSKNSSFTSIFPSASSASSAFASIFESDSVPSFTTAIAYATPTATPTVIPTATITSANTNTISASANGITSLSTSSTPHSSLKKKKIKIYRTKCPFCGNLMRISSINNNKINFSSPSTSTKKRKDDDHEIEIINNTLLSYPLPLSLTSFTYSSSNSLALSNTLSNSFEQFYSEPFCNCLKESRLSLPKKKNNSRSSSRSSSNTNSNRNSFNINSSSSILPLSFSSVDIVSNTPLSSTSISSTTIYSPPPSLKENKEKEILLLTRDSKGDYTNIITSKEYDLLKSSTISISNKNSEKIASDSIINELLSSPLSSSSTTSSSSSYSVSIPSSPSVSPSSKRHQSSNFSYVSQLSRIGSIEKLCEIFKISNKNIFLGGNIISLLFLTFFLHYILV